MVVQVISVLLELAKNVGEFFQRRKANRREELDRIADYMDGIADVLDRTAEAYGGDEAPYREYIELQQLATSFETVAAEAFGLEVSGGYLSSDLNGFPEFAEFRAILDRSLGVIAAVDAELYGLVDQPFPNHLWSGKSRTVDLREVTNPPISESRLDEPDWRTGKVRGEPSVHELRQAAGAFAAQAQVIRALRS